MSRPLKISAMSLLVRAAGRGLQWRLLFLWLILLVFITAVLATPVWGVVAAALDHSVHGVDWARRLNIIMFINLLGRLGRAKGALGTSAGVALVFLLAAMPLLNGLFIVAARSGRRLGLGELLLGGLREYGPMLRLMFWSLIPLGIALGAGAGGTKLLQKYAEHAVLESDVDHLRWAVYALTGLLYLYAEASVDAGRAWLASQTGSRSATKAWWRGLKLVLGNPLRILVLYGGLTLVGGILLVGLGGLRVEMHTGSGVGFVEGLAVTQAIVVVTAWLHFARLFALLGLTRALVGTASEPAPVAIEPVLV